MLRTLQKTCGGYGCVWWEGRGRRDLGTTQKWKNDREEKGWLTVAVITACRVNPFHRYNSGTSAARGFKATAVVD